MKKAFTLVELIVVITILAILATISYVSFKSYTKSARDSKRISDVTALVQKIEVENATGKKFTDLVEDTQENSVVINGNGMEIPQGIINFKNINENGTNFKDPLDEKIDYPIAYAVGGKGENSFLFIQMATISEVSNTTRIVGKYYKMNPEEDSESLFVDDIYTNGIPDNGNTLVYDPKNENNGGNGVLAQCPTNPNPESDFWFDDSTGSITMYLGTNLDVVIPCQIRGIDVENINDYAFYAGAMSYKNNSSIITRLLGISTTFATEGSIVKITSVTFPPTLKVIGNYAFSNNLLKNINLLSTIEEIGPHSFYNNPIESITNTDGKKSSEYIYLNDSNGIRIISFFGTGSQVVIPSKINGKKVVSIGEYAFYNETITSIKIPNTVEYVGEYAFNYKNLINITDGDGKNSSEYVYINKGTGIEIIGFLGESTDISIPSKINGKKVVSIGNFAFKGKKLTSVIISDGINNIGESAFESNLLVNILIPTSITNIGNRSFYGNDLTNITIPNSVTNIGDEAFKYNDLVNIAIPDSITNISYGVFASNKLTSVTIPNSVKSIGDSAFNGNQITSIIIPNSVKSIGDSAFNGNQITSIIIPNSVVNIGNYSFSNNKLTSITIPNSVTNIGKNAFRGNSISNIENYDGFSSSQYLYIKYGAGIELVGYFGYSTIPSIPDSINGKPVLSIGNSCFFSPKYKLTSVTIPNSVTNIGEEAFSGNRLTSLTLSNSLNSIGDRAFYNNRLQNIITPNLVTKIGNEAFSNNQLTSITIPDSVNNIGYKAFSGQYSSAGNGKIYGPSKLKTEYYDNTEDYFDKSKLTEWIVQ